ncbi:M14 family metallopeptidase [Sulfobacillus sp. hq2]|uniref:M14 family metallopeptidase n=1 Tax=Sulfobacillus TaxID=28033 RepID=UPI001A9A3C88|nr:M14 family metallopeptidase [Sulfobacillus sp. hq2]
MTEARYWTYQDMTEALQDWQRAYPDIFSFTSIGKSRRGRDLWAVTLCADIEHADRYPGLLVDANIHAGEVAGNAVAMHWIATLLEGFGNAPAIQQLLQTRAVYVVPRIAVDGAEEYLTTPARLRSSPHDYPLSEPPAGWVPSDVDGNGHILQMRVPSPDGAYAIDEHDPRLMRSRRPGEFGQRYYHVFTEGRVHPPTYHGKDLEGSRLDLSVRQGMDFNRNFPIRWATEDIQNGAGPFPLSEPEIYALAKFIEVHPNIAAYVALHTSGGVILRQPSTGDDSAIPTLDAVLYRRMGEEGARVSGYFSRSNYETFHNGYDPVLMPGAADDWMYDHQGVLGFTVEIWDLPRHAGARGYAEYGVKGLMKLSEEERQEDLRKILHFVEDKVPTQGFFPWMPFHHPDLGMVEIGGLDPKFVVQNPPLCFLEEECERVGRFLTTLGLSTAQLQVGPITSERIGDNVYRIAAMVKNQGFLPTSSTKRGGEMKRVMGVKAELAGNFEMIAGESPCQLGHLAGYGEITSAMPPGKNRKVAEWVVRAQPGTHLTLTFSAPRAGTVQELIVL